MKVTFYIYTFFLFSFFIAKAQFSSVSYPDHKFLDSTKTYVVIFGDEECNEKLKRSVETYWTATDYTFITLEQVDEYIEDENHSMLLPMVMGGDALYYMYYILIKTGKKSIQSYNYGDWYAYLIIPTVDRFSARADNIIQCMGNILSIMKEQQFEGGPVKIGNSFIHYYNQFTGEIKKGHLYIDEKLLHKRLAKNYSLISKFYPFSYTLCDIEKIEEIIVNKEKNTYYLVVDGSQAIIFEAATGRIIYCNSEFTPVYDIDKKVLKDIVKKTLEK